MSTAELPSQVSITERGERIIDRPPGIEEQLKKAAFEEVESNVFVKTHRSWNSDSEYKIAEAQIEGDQLIISVEDVIGIIDLTPSSRLQINPKIGWGEILEMFLTVHRYNRTLEFHGIPIKDFLSEDVDIEDVFVVIAANFLNSLEPLHRHGFIREFETKRKDAIDARGRIDIERSLLNLETGVPKQHYVQKIANYNPPINALIHCAGNHLLQLFQRSAKDHEHEEYYRIFSNLYDAVHELETMGIDSSNQSASAFRSISSGQLPRQRGYYKRAVEVSKMILSSSTGQSLEAGEEELTMDYLFNMENLFEEFSQIVLEEEIANLREDPLYVGFDDVRAENKPVLRPYEGTNRARHQPDHVLYKGDKPYSVVDSKYYEKDKDPRMIRPLRSQLFSYAFLLDIDQMAFLIPETPNKSPYRRNLRDREGEVILVSCDNEFTTEGHRSAIREYLISILEDEVEESQLVTDIREYEVALPAVGKVTVQDVLASDDFKFDDIVRFSRSVFSHSIQESSEVRARREIPKSVTYEVPKKLKRILRDHEEFDRCIPLFMPSSEKPAENEDGTCTEEALRLHFLKIGRDQTITETETIDHIPLDWKGSR